MIRVGVPNKIGAVFAKQTHTEYAVVPDEESQEGPVNASVPTETDAAKTTSDAGLRLGNDKLTGRLLCGNANANTHSVATTATNDVACWWRLVRRMLLATTAYALVLWLYIVCSSSHPSGYQAEEQHLGPFALLLLPLTPYVRYENARKTPSSSHVQVEQASIGDSSSSGQRIYFAAMPALQSRKDGLIVNGTHGDPRYHQQGLQMHLGSELSGCSAKFVLTDGQSKYLFKPNTDHHQVWGELLAYLISDLGGFERVPPVWPFEVPVKDIANPKGKKWSVQNMPFVKCDFGLDDMDHWIHNHEGDKVVGTLQLMVPGISKRSKTANRIRNKIGKWTDRKPTPSAFAKREINTRTAFDYIVGNFDRYNNDFVQEKVEAGRPQTQGAMTTPTTTPSQYGERISAYIDQGTTTPYEAIEWNFFELDDYCKFYWKPIQKLRHANIAEQVHAFLEEDPVANSWVSNHIIGIDTHPTMRYMSSRIDTVLRVVDKCLETHGHEYVFLT